MFSNSPPSRSPTTGRDSYHYLLVFIIMNIIYYMHYITSVWLACLFKQLYNSVAKSRPHLCMQPVGRAESCLNRTSLQLFTNRIRSKPRTKRKKRKLCWFIRKNFVEIGRIWNYKKKKQKQKKQKTENNTFSFSFRKKFIQSPSLLEIFIYTYLNIRNKHIYVFIIIIISGSSCSSYFCIDLDKYLYQFISKMPLIAPCSVMPYHQILLSHLSTFIQVYNCCYFWGTSPSTFYTISYLLF